MSGDICRGLVEREIGEKEGEENKRAREVRRLLKGKENKQALLTAS